MEDRKELVQSAQAGSSQAFAKLYEEIYMDLYHYTLYMLQNRHGSLTVAYEKNRLQVA